MLVMSTVYVHDIERSQRFYEALGYSLVVRDPDGLLIQINQHDPELYT